MHQFHVLLVADQVTGRDGWREAFAGQGCRVAAVGAAKEALAVLAVRRFDMVCLDPGDPMTNQVLAQLSPDQYALAWRGDEISLPPRFDGVLAGPARPILVAVLVAMARASVALRRAPPADRCAAA